MSAEGGSEVRPAMRQAEFESVIRPPPRLLSGCVDHCSELRCAFGIDLVEHDSGANRPSGEPRTKLSVAVRGLPSTHIGDHRAGWAHQLGHLSAAAGRPRRT